MQRTVFQKEKIAVELEPAKPQEPYNMLILGFDKRPKEKAFRSDTMILARVDPKTKEVWLISIPRDMRAEIPGHGHSKINDAYFYGKEQLAIDTVEKLTGQKINYYMGVNFTGFRRIVNAMGGVWINVPVEINDTEADPSRGNKYSHIDAGYQRLDGNHAITFVRARHQFADQDFSRMKNQQLFFKAAADQIANKTSVAKIPRIIATAAPYISTNMSLSQMLRTAQAMKGAGSKNVYATTLPGSWRTPYIWLDEDEGREGAREVRGRQALQGQEEAGSVGRVLVHHSGRAGQARRPEAVRRHRHHSKRRGNIRVRQAGCLDTQGSGVQGEGRWATRSSSSTPRRSWSTRRTSPLPSRSSRRCHPAPSSSRAGACTCSTPMFWWSWARTGIWPRCPSLRCRPTERTRRQE